MTNTATCSLPSSEVIIEPVPTYGIRRDVMLVDVIQTLECSEGGSSVCLSHEVQQCGLPGQ